MFENLKLNLNLTKCRTIKFDLIKCYDNTNYLIFKTINIGELQKFIIELCNQYNILFKTLKCKQYNCTIKICSDYIQFKKLYKSFLEEYGEYIINIKI